jgi:hypothetical protein
MESKSVAFPSDKISILKSALKVEHELMGRKFLNFLSACFAIYVFRCVLTLSRSEALETQPSSMIWIATTLSCYATLDCFRKEHQPEFALYQFMMPLPLGIRFLAKLSLSLFIYSLVFWAGMFVIGNIFQSMAFALHFSNQFQVVLPHADSLTLISFVYGHAISFAASAFFSKKSTLKMLVGVGAYSIYVTLLIVWAGSHLKIGDGTALSFFLSLAKFAENWNADLIPSWKLQLSNGLFALANAVGLLGMYLATWFRYTEIEVK